MSEREREREIGNGTHETLLVQMCERSEQNLYLQWYQSEIHHWSIPQRGALQEQLPPSHPVNTVHLHLYAQMCILHNKQTWNKQTHIPVE